jgi:hypothetical protein
LIDATLFGLVAVPPMLIGYALEARSPWCILACAGACALGSSLRLLAGRVALRPHRGDLVASRSQTMETGGEGALNRRSRQLHDFSTTAVDWWKRK